MFSMRQITPPHSIYILKDSKRNIIRWIFFHDMASRPFGKLVTGGGVGWIWFAGIEAECAGKTICFHSEFVAKV